MVPNPRIPAVLCLVLLAGPGGERLAAQQPSPVEIQGRVVDVRTSEPIAGATVLVTDSYGDRVARRITDDAGGFTVQARRRSAVRLRVGGLGYETVDTPLLHFDENDFFVVEVVLDVDAVPLAPLEVVARTLTVERSAVFEGFDHRAQRGFGTFFTRSEIEEIQPQRVTDLLQRVPGVRLGGGGAGHRRTVTMARSLPGPGGGSCPVQIYMDGRLMTRSPQVDIAVDDLVAPGDLEGMEVYHGLSSVPAEFLNPHARCGVVALWTRRGGDR